MKKNLMLLLSVIVLASCGQQPTVNPTEQPTSEEKHHEFKHSYISQMRTNMSFYSCIPTCDRKKWVSWKLAEKKKIRTPSTSYLTIIGYRV